MYCSGDKYLLPLIESSLADLKELKIPVFESVTNLNQITSNITSEKNLREVVNFFSDKISVVSDSVKKFQQQISRILVDNDYFLSININKLESILEYQFYLYNVKNLFTEQYDTLISLSNKNIAKPDYSTSFFINIAKNDYKDILRFQVAKMFPFTNEIPKAIIAAGTEAKKEIFLDITDSVTLNGNYSNDFETPFDNLTFKWAVLDKENKQVEDILIQKNGSLLKFFGSKIGEYFVTLAVNDGIADSKEDIVKLVIANRPRIRMLGPEAIQTISQRGALSKNSVQSHIIPVMCSNFRTLTFQGMFMLNISNKTQDTLELLKNWYETAPFIVSDYIYKQYPAPKSLYEYISDPRPGLNRSVRRIPEGFEIIYTYPARSFGETINVNIAENNLTSNTITATIKNRNYNPLTFFVEQKFHGLGFYKNNGRSYSSNVYQTSVGLHMRLLTDRFLDRFLDVSISGGGFYRNPHLSDITAINSFQVDIMGGYYLGNFMSMGVMLSNNFWTLQYLTVPKTIEEKIFYFWIPQVFMETPTISKKVPFSINLNYGLAFPRFKAGDNYSKTYPCIALRIKLYTLN
jgi:hypothetical protein